MSKTIWLTGMPCSGKTTLAKRLKATKFPDYQILDGDYIRDFIQNRDMTLEGRQLHLSYIAIACRLLNQNNVGVICAFVSPTNEIRRVIRKVVGEDAFYHVWINASREACMERDVKGMWAKAMAGEIKNFTGWDGAWEDPSEPDLIVNTEDIDIAEAVSRIHDGYNAWRGRHDVDISYIDYII